MTLRPAFAWICAGLLTTAGCSEADVLATGAVQAGDGSATDGGSLTASDTGQSPSCPASCPASGPCQVGACDLKSGTCAAVPVADGTPCSDGSACTGPDLCLAGQCSGAPRSCDDGNPCTDDACDPKAGCTWQAVPVPCDDGNACTSGDVCAGGKCQGQAGSVPCDDGSACTQDKCLPMQGCVHSPLLGPCDDGDACTGGDTCKDGQCQPGKPVCGCTSDAQCPSSGNACTGKSFCDLSVLPHVCKVDPASVVTCPPSGSPCAVLVCVPSTGQCVPSFTPGPCPASGPCATPGTCSGGLCQPGPAVDCNDGNPCTKDACTVPVGGGPGGGCSSTALADGAPCGPNHTCQQGKCQASCKVFEGVYGGPGEDSLDAVTPLNDGGWLVAGSTDSKGKGGSDGWLLRFSADNQVAWDLAVGSTQTDHLVAVTLATAATAVAVGRTGSDATGETSGWAVRFSSKGQVLWQKAYAAGDGARLDGVAPLSGGEVIAVGSVKSPSQMIQGWLVRLGPGGDVLWQQTLGFGSNDYLASVRVAGSAGLFTAGLSYTDGPQGDGDGLLARIDWEGNVVFTKQIGGPKYQTFSGLVVSGAFAYCAGSTNAKGSGYDGLLGAIKTNGETEWLYSYGGGKDDRFHAIAQFADGMLAVGLSDSWSAGDQDGWAVRLDMSGKQLWHKTFGGTKQDRFKGVAAVLDGGAVLVGTTGTAYEGGSPGASNGWVVRIDSAATSTCKQ